MIRSTKAEATQLRHQGYGQSTHRRTREIIVTNTLARAAAEFGATEVT